MEAIADALADSSLGKRWRAIHSIENHDIVYAGREARVARLADGSDARSWYARSRSRVATGLLLTAPGVPMLFMGQELLEARPWSDTPNPATEIAWTALDSGDKVTADFVRFTSELIALRRAHPALTGEGCAIVHVHDGNRVLAFERWADGTDNPMMVGCSLNETAWQDYAIGFPIGGQWRLLFDGDDYEEGARPVAGRAITADGPPLHGRPCSAHVAIPANGILVFAKG